MSKARDIFHILFHGASLRSARYRGRQEGLDEGARLEYLRLITCGAWKSEFEATHPDKRVFVVDKSWLSPELTAGTSGYTSNLVTHGNKK